MDHDALLHAIKSRLSTVDIQDDGKFANEFHVEPGEQVAFQNVLLNHPDGRTVLKVLADRMHFASKGKNMFELMERNMFLEILTMCGIQEDDIIEAIVSMAKRGTSGS